MNFDSTSYSPAYLRYLKLGTKSKASQKQIDDLAKEVKKDWWEKNRDRFIRS